VGERPSPTFAQIVQPNLSWAEEYSDSVEGITNLPKPGSGQDVAEMIVPEDMESPTSKAVRIHELLHAKHTPDVLSVAMAAMDAKKINALSVQIAEDVRLNHIANRIGVWEEDTHLDEAFINAARNALFSGGARDARTKQAALFMAGYGGPIVSWNSKSLADGPVGGWLPLRAQEAIAKWTAEVEAILAKYTNPKEVFLRLARKTEVALQAIHYPDMPPPEFPEDGPDEDGEGSPGEGGEGDKSSGKTPEQRAAEGPNARDIPFAENNMAGEVYNEKFNPVQPGGFSDLFNKYIRTKLPDARETKWGEMTIQTATLSHMIKAYVRRKGRAAPTGIVPIHWSRWFVDRAVFDRKGKRTGGTLLIDISGSMDLTDQQLEAIVDVAPAITIAAYSGLGATGLLTIIAQRGRRIETMKNFHSIYKHGGANVVDGPALAWLLSQNEPRVWFSDEQVTGIDDGQRTELTEEARRLKTMGNVKVTKDANKIAAIFSGYNAAQPATAEDSSY
jgi:hypothetical protein